MLFWPIVFHDPEAFQDQDLAALLGAIDVSRDAARVTRAYSAPPTWAGDVSRALCISTEAVMDLGAFVPGNEMPEQSARSITTFTDLIRPRARWLPRSTDLLSNRYQLRIHHNDGGGAVRLSFVPGTTGRSDGPGGEREACYMTVSF